MRTFLRIILKIFVCFSLAIFLYLLKGLFIDSAMGWRAGGGAIPMGIFSAFVTGCVIVVWRNFGKKSDEKKTETKVHYFLIICVLLFLGYLAYYAYNLNQDDGRNTIDISISLPRFDIFNAKRMGYTNEEIIDYLMDSYDIYDIVTSEMDYKNKMIAINNRINKCTIEKPLYICIKNNTNKDIRRIDFEIKAYSENVCISYPKSFSLSTRIYSHKEIEVCAPYPQLKNEYKIYRNVTFKSVIQYVEY